MMTLKDDNLKDLLSTSGLPAKPCDSCKTSPALLFCRPHSAFLCSACDADLHHKLLGPRHERVWICEVCEQFPADVTCKPDSAALCASCDRHIHSANPLAGRHQRLPVLPFFETPSVFSAVKPFPCHFPVDIAATATEDNWSTPTPHARTDFLPSDISSYLDLGTQTTFANPKLQSPSNRSYVADSEIPIQPKSTTYAGESCFQIDFTQSKLSQLSNSPVSKSVSSSESGVLLGGISNLKSDVSNSTISSGSSKTQPLQLQLPEMDRKAKVMRYREKKTKRKFQKTIRYASRKAYAERRPRVKGKFAKRIEVDAGGELEQIGFAVDHGVVPLF